jgi:peroxiredoxin
MVEKLILPFSLLADVEGEVIRRYGIWDEKGEISRPAIFVIDRPGDQQVYDGMNAAKGSAG